MEVGLDKAILSTLLPYMEEGSDRAILSRLLPYMEVGHRPSTKAIIFSTNQLSYSFAPQTKSRRRKPPRQKRSFFHPISLPL
jgi:hypothetical protein